MQAYLINVDATGNHNKFYKMEETGNGFFTATYGRVGAKGVTRTYPISAWNRKYQEKLRKGYVDKTDLKLASANLSLGNVGYAEIKDPVVARFMDDILQYANKSLKKSYRIDSDKVTEAMVREARSILHSLSQCTRQTNFNDGLLALFATIPRRMHNVEDYLISDISKKEEVLDREHELLDQMAAKVQYHAGSRQGNEKTILEAEGMTVDPVTSPTRLRQIRSHLGEMENTFYQAFRVRNKKLDEKFHEVMEKKGYTEKDIHYLYHGSRNQNWYSIMTNGLLLHPNAIRTASMFGNGLYFANKARKSAGYTSLRGYSTWAKGREKQAFLAVYKVLYNNPRHIKDWTPEHKKLNQKRIQPNDALFVHAGGSLYNDEIIVYEENRMTLQYIIELRV